MRSLGVDIGGVAVVQRPAQDQPPPPPPPSNARAATDVELGRSGGGGVVVVVVSSAGKPSHSPSTGSGRTAGRRPSPIAAGGGAHGTAVPNSRSPSDSNNNDEDETPTALRNSSAASVSALRREASGRQPGHFSHRQETRYHLVSDSPSRPKQRDPYYDDTDRGSTAV